MITLILTLAVVGCLVWFVTTKIPMAEGYRTLIQVIAAIIVVLYLLRVFGVLDQPVPQLR